MSRDTEHAGKELTLLVMACSVFSAERAENQFVCCDGAVGQRCINPPQCGDVVGLVSRSRFEKARRLRQHTGYLRMTPMQGSRRDKSVVDRPEHQGKHHVEGSVKARDRLNRSMRVFGDRRGDPWM